VLQAADEARLRFAQVADCGVAAIRHRPGWKFPAMLFRESRDSVFLRGDSEARAPLRARRAMPGRAPRFRAKPRQSQSYFSESQSRAAIGPQDAPARAVLVAAPIRHRLAVARTAVFPMIRRWPRAAQEFLF